MCDRDSRINETFTAQTSTSVTWCTEKKPGNIYHFCRMEFIVVNYKLLSQSARERERNRERQKASQSVSQTDRQKSI